MRQGTRTASFGRLGLGQIAAMTPAALAPGIPPGPISMLPMPASPTARIKLAAAQERIKTALAAAEGVERNFEELAAVWGVEKAEAILTEAVGFLHDEDENLKAAQEEAVTP